VREGAKRRIMKIEWNGTEVSVVGVPSPPRWEKHLKGTTWEYLIETFSKITVYANWRAIPKIGMGEKLHSVSVVWATSHTYQARHNSDTRSFLGWEWEIDPPLNPGETRIFGIPNKTTLFGIPNERLARPAGRAKGQQESL
jgi:hypothetical protein